jgi:hypothetical protein
MSDPDELRAQRNAYARAWMREHSRKPCRGGCGALVWTHVKGRTGYCIRCVKERVFRHNVRADTLRCTRCGQWKPDDAFYRVTGRSAIVRRGRKAHCSDCENESRQAYRDRRRVPCRHCGQPRTHPAERGRPDLPSDRDTRLCVECYRRLRLSAVKAGRWAKEAER